MEPSPAGLAIVAALLALGALVREPVLVGFIVSFAFGSTAVGTLGALGGSSPLVYAPLGALFCMRALTSRGTMPDLLRLSLSHGAVMAMLLLAAHAVASAVVLPRLFLGQVTAFVPIRGVVTEIPLAPSSGNFTQTAYLLLGICCFLAMLGYLRVPTRTVAVRRALLALCATHAGLALIDLIGKLAGQGDVLRPIRSASYALLTETEVTGAFWRIVGGFSEASAFSALALPCLAFAFTDWRHTGSARSALLAIALGVLTLLSTSTTAYVGIALLALPTAVRVLGAALRGRIGRADATLLVAGTIVTVLAAVSVAFDARVLDPFYQLIDEMVLNKLNSDSGVERTYWNVRSLEAFSGTYGLGLGMGSSRASSLVVAVISQLGIMGVVLIGYLLIQLAQSPRDPAVSDPMAHQAIALERSARAMALASFLAATISAGSADPGTLFFVCTGVVIAVRRAVYHRPVTQAIPASTGRHPQWT